MDRPPSFEQLLRNLFPQPPDNRSVLVIADVFAFSREQKIKSVLMEIGDATAYHLHRTVQKAILLGEPFTKHRYCRWEPSIREHPTELAPLLESVDFCLDELQSCILSFLGLARKFILG